MTSACVFARQDRDHQGADPAAVRDAPYHDRAWPCRLAVQWVRILPTMQPKPAGTRRRRHGSRLAEPFGGAPLLSPPAVQQQRSRSGWGKVHGSPTWRPRTLPKTASLFWRAMPARRRAGAGCGRGAGVATSHQAALLPASGTVQPAPRDSEGFRQPAKTTALGDRFCQSAAARSVKLENEALRHGHRRTQAL